MWAAALRSCRPVVPGVVSTCLAMQLLGSYPSGVCYWFKVNQGHARLKTQLDWCLLLFLNAAPFLSLTFILSRGAEGRWGRGEVDVTAVACSVAGRLPHSLPPGAHIT